MYDTIIKGGRVIDPAQGINSIRDIGVSEGKIAEMSDCIEDGKAKKTIDARGKIVSPGLIDLHAHVAFGVIGNGLPPDDCGVRSGVTTICDCGSTGIANFKDFRDQVISKAQTDVFCLLHIVPNGLGVMPENWRISDIDTRELIDTIEANREIIKGVKIRATGAMVRGLGLEGMKLAKRTAAEAGVPLMIHLGAYPEEPVSEEEMDLFTREMLNLLDKGDILTHIFTWKKGGVIKPDGRVMPELRAALKRGVILDVANARYHYSIDIARIAMEQGIIPHTLSTDLSNISFDTLVFSLLVTMSKFLTIGFDIEQLIRMTTMNPASVLTGGKDRGSLKKGMPADISILDLQEGSYRFYDGIEGKTFTGDTLITPMLTLKSGREIISKSRYGAG
ncbi:amidohydrolase/deacetylase family metallohydrolase [Thermodesulfobacteriota bacterium]